MRTSLISIGNSKGVIIPSKILKELGIEDNLELEIRQKTLLLRPANSRSTWESYFKNMAAKIEDQLLIDDVFEDEVFEVWK